MMPEDITKFLQRLTQGLLLAIAAFFVVISLEMLLLVISKELYGYPHAPLGRWLSVLPLLAAIAGWRDGWTYYFAQPARCIWIACAILWFVCCSLYLIGFEKDRLNTEYINSLLIVFVPTASCLCFWRITRLIGWR